MNCWEYTKCGREAGGANVDELGVCPAYPNYGTFCACVAGTYCNGQIQGTFAAKWQDCKKCAFFNSEHYNNGKK
jgi:hypothetical protein